MRYHHKAKAYLAMTIFSILLINGCVDTSVQTIPGSISYQSQIKVVNLITGAGTATLSLNGQALGSADFGNEVPGATSDFLTITAGSKTLSASFASAASKTYQFAATTDYRMRIFLVGTAATNELIASSQRYIWQTKNSAGSSTLFPADTGQVAFFNASPDAKLNSVTAISTASDTVAITFSGGLETGKLNGYKKFKAGTYAFDVLYNDTLHTTFTKDLTAKSRYTAVIYDAAASIKNSVLTDD